VQQHQRRGVRLGGARVQEVQVGSVDRGDELGNRVERRLLGAPVVLAGPVGGELVQVTGGDAALPAGAGQAGRPAGPGQAVAEVVDVGLRDVDAIRPEASNTREVEPHRLVHTPRRWYLVAWDAGRGDWRTFRLDRIQGPLGPPGVRFTPRELPAQDVAAYVAQSISSAPYRYQARILMHAPAREVARRSSPAAGRLEAVDAGRCVLHAGSDSLDELALYLALKGFDFQVLHPPELIPVLRVLAERLARAAGAGSPGADTRLPARPAAAHDGAGR
jgi:hypothetical protein